MLTAQKFLERQDIVSVLMTKDGIKSRITLKLLTVTNPSRSAGDIY